ncbi:MAG TPA: rod shape-determining protein MreC [Terriglobales bacterium]|nr:rod shape-determining protein MreC [Terriglobales bacterium]
MESVLGRYKNLIVLVVVLFAQVLGLAVQVKRTTDTESSRLIRIWAVNAVTPFEKILVWIESATSGVWHNYFYLRGIRAENRDLKEQIQKLRLEQVRLSEDAEQARRLQALFAFKEQYIQKTTPAQVIGSSGSVHSRIIYIDKGESDGIRPDMAVITPDGIVGKVFKAYRSTAQILLIDDQTSGVGAILERSRLQGILRGTANGEVVLEKVMTDEPVQKGEKVLTSGGDRIFPKGLPVGTVTSVSPGAELFLNIQVRPAANLGKLEEVLVVTEVLEKEPTPSENGPVRASDILAQRLPSVPDKPAEGGAVPPAAGSASQPPREAPAPVPPNAPASQGVDSAVSAGRPGPRVGARPTPPRTPPPGSAPASTGTLNSASAPSPIPRAAPPKVDGEAAPAKPKSNPSPPDRRDEPPSEVGPPQ